jgi:hypothetical protein
MGMFVIIASLTALSVVVGLFVASTRYKRSKEVAPVALPFEETPALSVAADSTPPSSDGVKVAARSGGTTPREQRQEDIRIRHETGLCLYCDKTASHVIPLLRQIRPVLDPLYRYLNVVPVNRWKIDVDLTSDQARPLCETHHSIARSHLERKIAENQVDYATFVERQRHEMYEFVEFALDERMLDDANAVKRGKKQKKVAEVTQLQRPNLKVASNGS